ncbi:MAG: TIGR03545 family protein [Pseudobdellovibrionaceae bacterium]
MANDKINTSVPPVKKPQGPIRFGAIIFFSIFIGLIGLYMHFFFDSHLRKSIEWGGYKALGVEVNLAEVKTSFINLHVRFAGLEITDGTMPSRNSVSIGEIRFGLLWDALLRARVVVNEAVIDQIEFAKPRKSPGRVRPPAPPSNEPSVIAKEAEKVKKLTLEKAEREGANNVFGDAVAMLQGGSGEAQLDQLKGNLKAEELAKKIEADIKQMQVAWEQRFKTLPQGKEFEDLGKRIGQVKTSNFKDMNEVQKSIQEIDKILKEGDQKIKAITTAVNDLNKDVSGAQGQVKSLEQQIQDDIKSLEQHFKIPKLDAKTLSRSIFQQYAGVYLAKANDYKALAVQYLPPKFTKKGTNETDDTIQPHPREKGVTYEFGRQNSYPLFWVKRVAVSSQAGASEYSGNISGEILDITSNQRMIGKATIAKLSGNFPTQKVEGFKTQLTLNNLKPQSEVTWDVAVAQYPFAGRTLVSSPEVEVAFEQAQVKLDLNTKLVDLNEFSFRANNLFQNIAYKVQAKNDVVDGIMKNVFANLPSINLEVWGEGEPSTPSLNFNSNLGPELAAGFGREVQAKINEFKARIEKQVRDEIEKNKKQIEAQINEFKAKYEGEINKVKAQADAQKKIAEDKTNEAKKDTENRAKKQIEEQGKKTLDDLKKKLGF